MGCGNPPSRRRVTYRNTRALLDRGSPIRLPRVGRKNENRRRPWENLCTTTVQFLMVPSNRGGHFEPATILASQHVICRRIPNETFLRCIHLQTGPQRKP